METEEKIVKMWNYINNQFEFIKECLVKSTNEGKNVSNIAIKYNLLAEIKDRFNYYFKDELQKIEDRILDNLPGFEDIEDLEK